MALPHTATLHTAAFDFLQSLASISKAHVECNSGKPAAETCCALRVEPVALLWQHARLNYLLPALAQVSIIVCAMHMSHGGHLPLDSSTCSSAQYVAGSEVVSSALWLRRLLAADVDDAIGVGTLDNPQHVANELQHLVEHGVLMQRQQGADSLMHVENESSQQHASPASTGVAGSEFAVAPASNATAAFCCAVVAPLVCTYCSTLQHAMSAVAEDGMACSELVQLVLAALRRQCQSQTCAIGAVPSKLLVQNAIDAWVKLAVLASAPSGVAAALAVEVARV